MCIYRILLRFFYESRIIDLFIILLGDFNLKNDYVGIEKFD